MAKTILMIAGGTGGHIFPALAIADRFTEQGDTVIWLGTEVGMEKQLVGQRYPMYFLPVRALRNKGVFAKFVAPFQILMAIFKAYRFIRKLQPDFVVGMGGYASGPGGIAAWLARKPLMIHEQNAIAGLTNRILSRFASCVYQAFPKTFPVAIQAQTVGNPVRESMTKKVKKTFNFSKDRPLHVLVSGGSQGALALNKVMVQMAAEFTAKEVIVWHQTGPTQFLQIQNAYEKYQCKPYRLSPFIEDMSAAYEWADLVICRSGALTVSELAVMGLPSILVPFPYAVDDHQTANANALVKNGAALLCPQDNLTPAWLTKQLKNFIADPEKLRSMHEQAIRVATVDAVGHLADACKAWFNKSRIQKV